MGLHFFHEIKKEYSDIFIPQNKNECWLRQSSSWEMRKKHHKCIKVVHITCVLYFKSSQAIWLPCVRIYYYYCFIYNNIILSYLHWNTFKYCTSWHIGILLWTTCIITVISVLWCFLVIFWSFESCFHLFALYGKEQREHSAKHLLSVT